MSQWPIRVLHLGLGRFHRAHQALYFQNLADLHDERWGIASFSMRTSEASDRLQAVNNRYPVIQFSKTDQKVQWIESIRETGFAKRDKSRLVELFASGEVSLLTLTVTEKAYQTPELISLVFEGLKNRSKKTGEPLTVLSCDNLVANGEKLRGSILSFAKAKGEEQIAKWIEEKISFPNTMVDRIVPELTPQRLKQLQTLIGTDNPEVVATESFTQWVIEDRFASEHPSFKKVGVELVSDVKAYEQMKLRLLNASHSALAYWGLPKGYTFVHEAIRDQKIVSDVRSLQAEVKQLIKAPENFSLEKYCDSLIERFDNERLPHQLKQIAMDGSQKLKQRILPSLESAAQKRTEAPQLRSAFEAWVRYCFENTPDDPLKTQIEALKAHRLEFKEFRERLIALSFPEDKNLLL